MVGEKFKAIRKAKGLTLEGAAKMLGLTAPRPEWRGFSQIIGKVPQITLLTTKVKGSIDTP